MTPLRMMIAPMVALCCAVPASAQTAPVRALAQLTPPGTKALRVSTPAWREGADIPFENTQYRGNIFPGLRWAKGPAATRSYAIIMQDVDVVRDGVRRHALHWTMVNIPATVTRLQVAMPAEGKPAGSSYGPNYKGQAQPYLGPRPPPGLKHRYHIQIFALDTLLTLPTEASYADLIGQMRGHVLASGETVGLGQADPTVQR